MKSNNIKYLLLMMLLGSNGAVYSDNVKSSEVDIVKGEIKASDLPAFYVRFMLENQRGYNFKFAKNIHTSRNIAFSATFYQANPSASLSCLLNDTGPGSFVASRNCNSNAGNGLKPAKKAMMFQDEAACKTKLKKITAAFCN